MRRAAMVFCLFSVSAWAQETFYNWTILRLWRGGVNQSEIINQIRVHPEAYSLTAEDLRDLAELPQPVIDAMRAKHAQGNGAAAPAAVMRAPAQPAPAPPPPTQPSTQAAPTPPVTTAQPVPAPPPAPVIAATVPMVPSDTSASMYPARTDLVVRIRRGAGWLTVPAEQMTWQTHGALTKVRNGVLKVPTAGMVGRPIKAQVDGEHSRVLAPNPLEMIIDVPAGSSTQNYLLVQLDTVKGQRKFQVGGNRTHGAHRSMPFYLQKVPTNSPSWDEYRVELQDYMQGEYGIFDARSVYGSRAGNNQVANIYTFSMP
jgi:hypothetical protein